jgi:hypothetical protein
LNVDTARNRFADTAMSAKAIVMAETMKDNIKLLKSRFLLSIVVA